MLTKFKTGITLYQVINNVELPTDRMGKISDGP